MSEFDYWAFYNGNGQGDNNNGDNNQDKNNNYVGGGVNPAYTQAAYAREMDRLLSAQEGTRNHTLNEVCFSLARFIYSGDIAEAVLRADLERNARAIGLAPGEITKTIGSAFQAARDKIGGSRGAPPPEQSTVPDAYTIDPASIGTGVGGDDEQRTLADLHRIKVEHRAYELRVAEEARLLFSAQQAAALNQKAPDPINLVDFLAVPDEDATYRIDGLLPVGARALFVAQYKTGKTTSIANLVRSLADGHPFLSRFTTEQVNRVTIIDTELDERMLRRWLRKQGIVNRDRIQVVSMKGKLATFDILDSTTRASWARRLAGSDFVILDCLRPCLDALGLSEDKDGGKFCVAWDALMEEAGVQESVVVHHAGHNSERSRGDSRLLDWPDVIWKLVKETQTGDEGSSDLSTLHDGGKRFFSAHGRDVNIPECMLQYAPEDGSLHALEGSRGEIKAREIIPDLKTVLAESGPGEGLTMTVIEARMKELGHSRSTIRKAVQCATRDGVVIVSAGAKNASVHILNPAHSGGDFQ